MVYYRSRIRLGCFQVLPHLSTLLHLCSMTVKRRNHGRNKAPNARGMVRRVRCEASGESKLTGSVTMSSSGRLHEGMKLPGRILPARAMLAAMSAPICLAWHAELHAAPQAAGRSDGTSDDAWACRMMQTCQAQTHMPISSAGVLVPKDKAIKRFIVSCAGL